jgi:hypothetical protein
MHFFAAELSRKGGINIDINKHLLQGEDIEEPCWSPVGYLGLSVSYDVRFP